MSKKLQTQKYSSLLGHDIQQEKQKQVYIYAEVDIDKLYNDITSKGKKVQKFMEDHSLQPEFLQKMRDYKHLRICFDNQIQQFVFKKELNKELKNVKKNVLLALEDFLVTKFMNFLQEERLHREYNQKVREIQGQFEERLHELMKDYA